MSLFPKNLNEYVTTLGIPRGPLSKAYLVDPVNGDDDNSGTNWLSPLKSLEAAEDLCVANRHDCVLFLAGATADNPTASITWDKSYTHLIGIGSELFGVGQRCRVVMLAATAASPVITFSGNGCIIKNMQFNNEKASGAAAGVAIITGQRCFFENIFFMVPTSVTAASYSAKVSGGENVFKRCTFGQHTLLRSAADYGLWIHKGDGDCQRNKFIDCEFLSWSNSADHVLVKIDADIDVDNFTVQFENCLFDNMISGSGTLTAAIVDGATDAHHQIILRGQENCVAGCTAVANPLTYVLKAETGTGTQSGLLMATVNES